MRYAIMFDNGTFLRNESFERRRDAERELDSWHKDRTLALEWKKAGKPVVDIPRHGRVVVVLDG